MTAQLLALPAGDRLRRVNGHPWLLDVPDGRDLERGELRRLAVTVAGARETWVHFVRRDATRRHYVQLHRDPHLDVWLLCWTDDQETGLHDHDLSSGAVHVCEGRLVEERLELQGSALTRVSVEWRQGATFDFDASHIHCLRHAGGQGLAVSIHVYSPALWRMGYYEAGAGVPLRRISVSHADEVQAADGGGLAASSSPR